MGLGPTNRARRARRSPQVCLLFTLTEKYGEDGVDTILHALRFHRTHRSIAKDLGVTRQCVQRWARVLGTEVEVYQVHPDISRIAREQAPEGVSG